jgi:hypothetical protein
VRDSHYAAEYFIHKRAEQLPYSTNVRSAQGRPRDRAIALALARVVARGRLQLQLREARPLVR